MHTDITNLFNNLFKSSHPFSFLLATTVLERAAHPILMGAKIGRLIVHKPREHSLVAPGPWLLVQRTTPTYPLNTQYYPCLPTYCYHDKTLFVHDCLLPARNPLNNQEQDIFSLTINIRTLERGVLVALFLLMLQ